MKIFFIRHGESEANVNKILSSRPEEPYNLTPKGITQIKKAARNLSDYKITDIYSSPLVRTIHSANIIKQECLIEKDPIIDNRLTEVNYGKYSGHFNNSELDSVRLKQVNGDYEIRFGEYGENRRQILTRICDFLIDIIKSYQNKENVVVVSHGTVITIAENLINTIQQSTSKHAHTKNADIKSFSLTVDDLPLFNNLQKDLLKLQQVEIDKRVAIVNEKFKYFNDIEPRIQSSYKLQLIEMVKTEINNTELNNEVINMFLTGFYLSNIKALQRQINVDQLNSKEVILICVFKNAKKILNTFISHYKNIGVNNFVFIDNNSEDGSLDYLTSLSNHTKADIWVTKDKFDSFKSCGWRQRMIAYYGNNRWYLDLDVDELLVFPGVENSDINKILDFAHKHKLSAIGSLMLDIYPKRPILTVNSTTENLIADYKYIDIDTYTSTPNVNYNYRIFGGPRYRVLKVRPSLQKIPLIFIDGHVININPHFWYPFKLNLKTRLVSALLHYKFLPGDLKQYQEYARTGVHWNNSSEYKIYVDRLQKNPKLIFFSHKHSIEYKNSTTLKKLKKTNGQSLLDDIDS